MTDLATLVNLGAAGAVIGVVVLFLRFIEARDKQQREFFASIRQADGEALRVLAESIRALGVILERLIVRIDCLENKFDAHDATEMEFLRGVVANQDARQNRRTQPRPPKAGGA